MLVGSPGLLVGGAEVGRVVACVGMPVGLGMEMDGRDFVVGGTDVTRARVGAAVGTAIVDSVVAGVERVGSSCVAGKVVAAGLASVGVREAFPAWDCPAVEVAIIRVGVGCALYMPHALRSKHRTVSVAYKAVVME